MDETMRFRCAQSLIDLVDEHAKRERRSRSNQLRVIVEDWLMDRAEAKVPELTPEQVDAFLYPQRRAAAKLVDTPEAYDAEAQ